jgi:hypothetical protein
MDTLLSSAFGIERRSRVIATPASYSEAPASNLGHETGHHAKYFSYYSMESVCVPT